MNYETLEAQARARYLSIFGAFHPEPEDNVPHDARTLLLLGPHEPGFWAHVTAEPEFMDDQPDPLDRWSRRVIGRWACNLGAKALFPFGRPPYHPFFTWALRSGRAWASPVQLLVHDTAGLFVSYRGAIALQERISLPPPGRKPCDTCVDRPCEAACPVTALTLEGYDVPACKSFVQGEGMDCRETGCAVRRACPISATYGRQSAQSAFHMRAFLG